MPLPRMITAAALLLSACAPPLAGDPQAPLPPPLLPVECVVEEGKHLSVRAAGREILRYAIGSVEAPAGVDPVHAAAGFLHPVRTPSGVLVSDSFSASHPHHHGVWSAWRQGEFEGRNLNGFAPLERLGRMDVVSVEGVVSGPVAGGFRARQRLVDLHAPGGPKPALEERWEVKVYATEETVLFDIVSTQAVTGGSAFTVRKYHYGGMGFRGSREWTGKTGVTFLTSEGKGRLEGNGVPARWVVMNGRISGKDAGVGLLCHPSSFRAPQPVRLNPDDPYFSWVPACDAAFAIEPGKPGRLPLPFRRRGPPVERGGNGTPLVRLRDPTYCFMQ